jgi:ribosomal protein S18 acetylase RimI-like enzyme
MTSPETTSPHMTSPHMTSPEMPAATVRRAAGADAAAAAGILAAAFLADPVFAWLIPDPARRAELHPPLFRVLVDGHLALGGVYTAQGGADDGPAAAAVWVPEGTEPDPEGEAAMVAAFMELAAENAGRLETCLGLMAEVHPHADHAYLFVIGAAPERQGRGLGSALIRHVTERLDRDGTAAYLEATCESNRRLYARHGFADVGIIQLPDGPPMYRMWRDPR